MADSFTRGESSHQGRPEPLRSSQLPENASTTTQVVLVMDGLKEFTIKSLKWVLENISASGGINVTLLGAMPWLNIPLSAKTWQGIWAVGFEELAMAKEQGDEWKSDSKYVKLQAILDLCKRFGVNVPQKEVVMGYPLKLMVVEKLKSLNASWVVFDRHQRRDMEFIADKFPCNMVMINENDEPVIIKMQPLTSGEFTSGGSPASFLPSPL
ncbi:hypothetical protein POPTR_001G141900v4 [Populus trichocarpa]|uniref:Uncharacterized protein n=1 Tax=Populus trichocarpa TaxID=3694 RepID=B9MU28_POPTR|nr:uncharacterized protein LOC18094161 [Populus trichocarpa]KAI5602003.1 hypothetical protein BDE02_01G128600 [Populus trichocarpa]PNT54436.2 hypothetical protein POPTR_001G141900v4 [Populus trichocarpa]|eukprot:XP_024451846.1 uncharacterized protein LOC18094161 [Populus trichocarpa]